MSRLYLSDYIYVRTMRLMVLVVIAAVALAVPFEGFAAPSRRTMVARDSFSRSVGTAWGVADKGGRYRTVGRGAAFRVAGGKGRITLKRPGAEADIELSRVSVRDVVVKYRVGIPKVADRGGVSVSAVFRSRGNGNQYQIRTRIAEDGSVWLSVIRVRSGSIRAIGERGSESPVSGWAQAGRSRSAHGSAAAARSCSEHGCGLLAERSHPDGSSSVPIPATP